MIGDQLKDFSPRERFAEMVLGAMSLSRRVAAVSEIPRTDGLVATPPNELLLDFFLGAISIGRTLGAIVSCDAAAVPRAAVTNRHAAHPPARRDLLR